MSATAPLAWVHPHRCFVRFPVKPGEIRRMGHPSSPKTLFALDLGCPACGAWNTWIARDDRFAPIVEGELEEVRPDVDDEEDRRHTPTLGVWLRPTTITTERRSRCVGCKCELTIAAGVISAT